LATTALLIVGGAGGLLLVEPHSDARRYGAIGRTPVYYDNTRNQRDWPRMSAGQRFQAAMFQSISARTAGFSTIDPTELSNAGKLWMCGLMIVGGSPGSAAGGMKTVTAALILLAVWSALRRRDGVGAFGRDVPTRTVQTAFVAGLLYLLLVGAVALLLSMAMRRGLNAIDLLFEAVSACGAAGLSTGVTAGLNVPGKSVIIAGMFIGRTALPALMLIMAAQAPRVDRHHPKEDIILG
jgi:trk system potassium uptake protein TrkH